MRCNKDCLNCIELKCKHDVEDAEEYERDEVRKRDKVRHAEYYKKHKAAIDAKQKEYDKTHDRKASSKRYYEQHKKRINADNNLRYHLHREERKQKAREYYQEHKEEIAARRKELRRMRKDVMN